MCRYENIEKYLFDEEGDIMKINYTMFETRLTGGVRVLLEIANRLVER